MGEYLHKEFGKKNDETVPLKLKWANFITISEYGSSHYLLKIFGIKIKFLKKEFAQRKLRNPYYIYKKNNIDITTLPPAKGRTRNIQLANLVLLDELDYVCRQSGLKYWLDGGTLLGAVRHKGFIPWDDDIDTSMLREDYARIKEAFEKHSRNPDIYVDYYRSQKNTCNCYLRVQHRKCETLFVDIFPWDSYGKILSKHEQIKKSAYIKKIRKNLEKICTKEKDNFFVLKTVAESMQKDVLINSEKKEKNSDYVWGMDFGHPWKNWFTAYDVVHPFSEIEFEGKKYPCLNNPDTFLRRVYGDYMNYPKKLTCGHSMYREFSEKEIKVIHEIIGDRNG